MALGPVDVAIIQFPGSQFRGEIAPAIADLVERGIVRVLDLLFVVRDEDGSITTLELEGLGPDLEPMFSSLEVTAPGTLDADDAAELDEDLAPGDSALLIAWENTWLADTVQAIRNAGGQLLDQVRIPADVVEATLGAEG